MTRRRRRAVTLLLVAVVLASALAPVAAVGASSPDGRSEAGVSGATDVDHRADAAPERFALQQVDADDVLMAVDLQANGDARWTVTYRVRLETDNETAAFRSLRDEIRANPENFTGRFGDRMRATASAAENATGREMAVRNVSVSAEIQSVPRYGIVTYTFEWTNFAAVEGDTIRAGDALSGLYLDEKTRLKIRWPAGYDRGSATPDPTGTADRSVTWSGPLDFGSDQPRLVVSRQGPLAGLWPLLGGLVVVVLAGLAAWRYRDRLPIGRGGATGDEPATGTGDGAAAGGTTAAPDDAGGEVGEGAESGDDPPEELLSNEERVLKFVREQGGRVKQQEIVEAMDWTEAKTSQVVRDLRDDGDLEGFRLGRENVLRLPGEDEEV